MLQGNTGYYESKIQNFGITQETIEQQYKSKVLSLPELDYYIQKDISNIKGVLLARTGSKINNDIYQKILNHQLMEPLDEYLGFASQVSVPKILDQLVDIAGENLDLNGIDLDSTIDYIKDAVEIIEYDHIVLNKLTVLKTDKPYKFNHSLTTALISTEIGVHLNFSRQDLAELFSVCMFHDIGELHLDRNIYIEGDLTADKIEKIRMHPVISYQILKGSKTEFSQRVLQAVLCHHERLNGSGYPLKLRSEDINQFARIIAVIDTYDAIRRKGGTIKDALSVLKHESSEQVTSQLNSASLSQEIVLIIEDCIGLQTDENEEDKSDLYDFLVTNLDKFNTVSINIKNTIKILESSVETMDMDSSTKKSIEELVTTILNIRQFLFDGSGIDNSVVKQLKDSSEGLLAIRQVMYQLAPGICKAIAAILGNLNKILKKCKKKNESKELCDLLLKVEELMKETQSNALYVFRNLYPEDFSLI